ncbi:hypothetical protein [Parashewanella tropica]|uniref:hypothetical protein n=1 Tax=Parashewanella tropica TaxID=2547970 RepID=UPI001059F6A5|nr:hypothetical protein [Parashewanella tropica]
MTTQDFIDEKAPQLAHYGKAFLSQQIDYNEVQLYLWDTLEEWQRLEVLGDTQTDTETVFWHLLHSFSKWPAWAIRGNHVLRQQISDCCDFLVGDGAVPQGIVGARPDSAQLHRVG